MDDCSPQELMVAAGAREIMDHQIILVGIGLPQASAMLAKLSHAPHATLLLEMGAINPNPVETPRGLADPRAWYRASGFTSTIDIMGMNLHRGLVDLGFVGALEIDPLGNINSTMLKRKNGSFKRFGGSGGLNDIVSLARKTIVIIPHDKRKFNQTISYITGFGYPQEQNREDIGLKGGGPYKVITDKSILEFDNTKKRFILNSIHPAVTIDEVIQAIQFDIDIPKDIRETPEPTPIELKLIREVIDPKRIILR